jgi:flagellar biosynthesis/type III secretory pathway protein FliH
VIEALVKEQQAAMESHMQGWMQETAAGLQTEYNERLQTAIHDALAHASGATSGAGQPELA